MVKIQIYTYKYISIYLGCSSSDCNRVASPNRLQLLRYLCRSYAAWTSRATRGSRVFRRQMNQTLEYLQILNI